MRLIPNTRAWRDAVPDSSVRARAWVAGYAARIAASWQLQQGRPLLSHLRNPHPPESVHTSDVVARASWQRGWQAADQAEGRRLQRGAEAAREEMMA